jgi:hypothetical protein
MSFGVLWNCKDSSFKANRLPHGMSFFLEISKKDTPLAKTRRFWHFLGHYVLGRGGFLRSTLNEI